MITDWIKGLDETNSKDISERVRNSRVILGRLSDLCKAKIKEVEVSSIDDYDSPSWAYRAADKAGYKRALEYILLLTKENK